MFNFPRLLWLHSHFCLPIVCIKAWAFELVISENQRERGSQSTEWITEESRPELLRVRVNQSQSANQSEDG